MARKLSPNDLPLFRSLIRLFESVFEMRNFEMPPDDHLQRLLSDEKFMVFVELDDNNEVVGGLTAYTLTQYYSLRPLTYIYDLAVAVPHQRKGIGRRLISAINDYCQQAGMEEVFVQADKADDYALEFYRKTEPTAEEEVVHYYYSLGAR